jgi:hypothetical protein
MTIRQRRTFVAFRLLAVLPLLLVTSPTYAEQTSEPTPEQIEFFESKVRPIFVAHCYECHSTSAEDVEAGLLLDSRWGWKTGGDSGAAIIPGNLDDSLVIDAVRYQENIVSAMPPRSKLPDKEIQILERWVEMGAPDPREKPTDANGKRDTFNLRKRFEEHWSWRPVGDPVPPSVTHTEWPHSELDKFVLSRMEQADLLPAGDADKRTWLRRVSFDLIGLPPTPDQIADFVADNRDDAKEQKVDELLRSPHFGEKWARHWMDLVRYAETYGHEFDYPIRGASHYRDYLIRAFNADVPFDEFAREHIAGDLLPDPRQHPEHGWNESVIGTGFWYLHEATHAPTDVLGNEADIVDNQIDVFGKAFLGLTIACARCHDHKFDAISTADYYALSAYLQSSCRQDFPLDRGHRTGQLSEKIDALRRDAAEQMRTGVSLTPSPADYFQVAEALATESIQSNGEPRSLESIATEEGIEAERLQQWIKHRDAFKLPTKADQLESEETFCDFGGNLFEQGWSTSGNAFRLVGEELAFTVDGKLACPETIDSGINGNKQVGTLRSPTFEISTNQIHLRMKASSDVMVRLIIDNYQMAEFNALLFRGTFLNKKSTDTGGQWAWKTLGGDLRKYLGHKAYLEFVDPGNGTIALDQIVFSDRGPPKTRFSNSKPSFGEVRDAWNIALEQIQSGRGSRFAAHLSDSELLQLSELSESAERLIAEARQLAAQVPAQQHVLAMAQGTSEDAHIYIRGSHANLGESVPARFLEALDGQPASRLDLADRVASPDNPLTSRVIVNRVWHHLFGRGIVPTVDDFGPQGIAPSHPELLDWLARDLINHNWSLKHLIKSIVLSRTYGQSSRSNDDLSPEIITTRDPANRLLHRMPIRRLQAEAIRDAMLVASGRLDTTLYGNSIATHRTPFMTGRGARPSGPLDGAGRRSIYLSIYRNFLNPFMLTFDMPSPFGPQGRRSRSNVPAQALTLLNDPFVMEQSKVMAQNILENETSSTSDRIATLVERVHGIRASDEQVHQLEEFLDQQASLHGKLDIRAWSDLCHSLFNMKAFYFVR